MILGDGTAVTVIHVMQSVQSGIVPNDLKSSSLLKKKREKRKKKKTATVSCNYRPVSILRSVSKIY